MLYQQENFGIENHHDIRLYTSINFVSHLHRDAELVCVMEGKLYISTDKGREALSAGDCALILPDKIHSYETPEYSKAVVHVFSADNAGSFFKKIRGFEGERASFTPPKEVSEFYADALVRRQDYGKYTLKGCLYLMLEAYSSQVKLVPCDTGKNKSIIGAIFAYVSEHFREPITLTDLEDVCGYSAHYLSRVFSEAVGINFRRFVNELRLEYARELLTTTDLPVTEIAYKSGFGSIRSFNRAFGDEYHSVPKKSRGDALKFDGEATVLYLNERSDDTDVKIQ